MSLKNVLIRKVEDLEFNSRIAEQALSPKDMKFKNIYLS